MIIKTIELVETKFNSLSFNAVYNRQNGALEGINMSATATVYDSTGEPTGTHSEHAVWNDLPEERRLEAKSFLQWVSKIINNRAVDEDVEQPIPDLMGTP